MACRRDKQRTRSRETSEPGFLPTGQHPLYLLPRPGKSACDFLGARYSDLFHCFNLQCCADASTSQTATEQIRSPSSYGRHFRKGNGGGWFCFTQTLLWEREITETRGPSRPLLSLGPKLIHQVDPPFPSPPSPLSSWMRTPL